ncbi:MAG: hypothetical protein QNJ66_20140 [Crocosphaera sp.]|nr:hypothetical protein [Crocosphaera sp.]
MKLKVTKQGVLIPREILGDSQEVEIIQQQETIIIKIKKRQENDKLPSSLEPRKPCYWRGKVKIADDFDTLPDDIQNIFMGLSE